MTLILSNQDVDELLTMPECLAVLEDAYLEFAAGRGVNRRRSDSLAPTARPDALYALKTMDGIAPKFGVGAVRIDSDIVTATRSDGNLRREKIPAAPGGRWVGLVLLFSTETGEPLAILPDGYLQRLRVGACNGLGIKYLAREDARTVALLGSGWQAGGQALAAAAVRRIDRIRCYSPNPERRRAFARAMSEQAGVEIVPVETPEQAVTGADIVLCATNSLENVFFERWLEPGMHVSSIKRPEIEAAAVRRAHRVVIHARDPAPSHAAAAGIVSPEVAEGKGWTVLKELDFGALPTLPELIAGRMPGRDTPEQITCFINNIGMGYQFAAAGAAVYRKAKAEGRGREFPTGWFTQDVHP